MKNAAVRLVTTIRLGTILSYDAREGECICLQMQYVLCIKSLLKRKYL